MTYTAGQRLTASELTTALLSPSGFAYQTIAQSINSGAYTKVTLDTVDFDTNGVWDATNNRWTPVTLGVYSLEINAAFSGTSATGWRFAALYKNGSATRRSASMTGTTVAGATFGCSFPIEVTSSTDYFELFIWQNSGGALNTYTDGTNCSSMGITFIRTLT